MRDGYSSGNWWKWRERSFFERFCTPRFPPIPLPIYPDLRFGPIPLILIILQTHRTSIDTKKENRRAFLQTMIRVAFHPVLFLILSGSWIQPCIERNAMNANHRSKNKMSRIDFHAIPPNTSFFSSLCFRSDPIEFDSVLHPSIPFDPSSIRHIRIFCKSHP